MKVTEKEDESVKRERVGRRQGLTARRHQRKPLGNKRSPSPSVVLPFSPVDSKPSSLPAPSSPGPYFPTSSRRIRAKRLRDFHLAKPSRENGQETAKRERQPYIQNLPSHNLSRLQSDLAPLEL
ncbi:Hypothetical protein NTJ_03530 [Nesidiocoris tenuis]|uniref:Uncharacterized protein n=1 Tax=Nesidiocoris tenuis TaxID=355587 RepID=A0ABN7AHG5_9HEMI|nr:Hypothetical protein NTJ_03530 [Nesidiocoris tenuis]